jgi:hypothetical protein
MFSEDFHPPQNQTKQANEIYNPHNQMRANRQGIATQISATITIHKP